MQIFLYFGLFIAIFAILFAVQNNDPVTVSFIIWKFEGSLALILLITMAIGALISSLISIPNNVKVRWDSRNLRKKIVQLEDTVDELQNNLQDQKRELQDSLETIKQLQLYSTPSNTAILSVEEDTNDEGNIEEKE